MRTALQINWEYGTNSILRRHNTHCLFRADNGFQMSDSSCHCPTAEHAPRLIEGESASARTKGKSPADMPKIRTQNPSALRHNELGARGPVPLCGQRLFLLASYFLTCTNEDFRLVMVPTLDLAGLTGMAILLAELLLAPRGSVPSTPPLRQCCSARNHTIGEFVLDYMGLLYNRSTPRAFSSIPHHPPHHTHIHTTTTSFSLFDRFPNRQSLQVTNSNFFASQPALLFANSPLPSQPNNSTLSTWAVADTTEFNPSSPCIASKKPPFDCRAICFLGHFLKPLLSFSFSKFLLYNLAKWVAVDTTKAP